MRQHLSPRRLAVAFAAVAAVLVCAAAASGQNCNLTNVGACVRNSDNVQLLEPGTSTKPIPILFVHGHGGLGAILDDVPNYQKNWQDSLRGLPSFKTTLDQNTALGIEPYYLELAESDNRSITQDAREIGEAIELILRRHNPDYPEQAPIVRVAIIAYSKGTISARQYLKSLRIQVEDLPPPRPDFHPVSEFVAIAPPNHGISLRALTTNSLSVKQLYDGKRPAPLSTQDFTCGDSFGTTAATDYITRLNLNQDTNLADEAPGSRNDGQPPTSGTLYVTLFDALDRDFAGGDANSTDCEGRRVATNRAAAAVNIPIDTVKDDGWQSVPGLFGQLTETERKSVSVHQNTVHTPLVICKALFIAVHHRGPGTEDCSLSPDAVTPPTIPPARRAAVMLTLDFSGSMSALACPECATRAEVLKDAVELFVQLWSAVGVPSDRLGVNYFQTDVNDQFNVGGDRLPLLSDGGDDVIASVVTQTPGGSTAMGGGIKRAVEELDEVEATTPIRRVILFTDGMQNVNPMVVNQNNQLVIANQAGRQNSNVPELPLTVLDDSSGIAVDTIGVGAGERFVGLLQDIAAATGGRTWSTTDPGNDLRRFFVEELINALKGFSPQLVAYRRGSLRSGSNTESFAIEAGARKLVFKVSSGRGRKIDFSVERDGVDVTYAGRFINGEFYKIFVIDPRSKGLNTSRGNWRLKLKGEVSTSYETAAIVDGGTIKFDALFRTPKPTVGVPLDLLVRVGTKSRPLSQGVKVTVNLTRPAAQQEKLIEGARLNNLSTFEPGLSLAERKQLALVQKPETWKALKSKAERVVIRPNQRGEFRVRIRPLVPGVYTATITIDGDLGKSGRFSRTLTAVTVVRSK